jgi:putative hydrolase of the HAD superfamily
VARFVIFDLYDTLVGVVDLDRDRVVAEMAEIVGVEPARLVDIYNATWRQRQTEWGVEQTVSLLAQRLGGAPSPGQVAQAAELRREFGRQILATVQPSTIAVLGSLRRAGCKIGLVSNATADSSEAWPDTELAGYFDVAVFSCDAGAAKPDRRIYLAATAALGAEPATCVYVGDGGDRELTGARALGMTVYRTTEHADRDPSWTGPRITSLAELPPLLELGLS